jgi:hypothetical protein
MRQHGPAWVVRNPRSSYNSKQPGIMDPPHRHSPVTVPYTTVRSSLASVSAWQPAARSAGRRRGRPGRQGGPDAGAIEPGKTLGVRSRARLGAATCNDSPAAPAAPTVAGNAAPVVTVARVAAVVPVAHGAGDSAPVPLLRRESRTMPKTTTTTDAMAKNDPTVKPPRAGSPDTGISLPASAPALQRWMQRGELHRRGPSDHECRFVGVVY